MTGVSLDADRARLRAWAQELATLEFVLRGSIVQTRPECGKPTCRCHTRRPPGHGPYWQWTRKEAGRTVTVVLSREQAALLEPWIRAARRADRVLGRMERATLQAARKVVKKARAGTR